MRVMEYKFIISLIIGSFIFSYGAHAEQSPIAEIMGKNIYMKDLSGIDNNDLSSYKPEQWKRYSEVFRSMIWQSVFSDYVALNKIEPTKDEIETLRLKTLENQTTNNMRQQRHQSVIEAHRKAIKDSEGQILKHNNELTSADITPEQIKVLNDSLDKETKTLKRSKEALEYLEGSEYKKMQEESGRRVAKNIAKNWKINQTLYKKYGGRIIFQQLGWEPVDAYKKLLEEYQEQGKFKVLEPALEDAVYSYFKHNFVYADEGMAEFYFEKPYWQRTEEEMIKSGFKNTGNN